MPYHFQKEFNRYKATNLVNQSQWFDSWQDAENFSNSGGPLTEYKGFGITPQFQITKNGKFVFTAYHQRCDSFEQCVLQIDASIIAGQVMAKLPNLSRVSITGFCELENGSEKREYEENQINNYYENELNNSLDN